jgi:hypothetical protein
MILSKRALRDVRYKNCAVEVASPLTPHSMEESFSLTLNVWQRTPGPNAEDLFVGIKRGI